MTDLRPTPHAYSATGQSITVRPVVLAAPERGADPHLRVTAPVDGTGLPVLLFSHGFGMSMDAYGPVVDYWAAHGIVVVQPTHLDSASLGLAPDDPRGPRIWRHRIEDLVLVLDELDTVLDSLPGLTGRADVNRWPSGVTPTEPPQQVRYSVRGCWPPRVTPRRILLTPG